MKIPGFFIGFESLELPFDLRIRRILTENLHTKAVEKSVDNVEYFHAYLNWNKMTII